MAVRWLAAGLFCWSAVTAQAWLFGDNRLSKLPTPVRQTVVSVLGSGRLTELWQTNENGHAVYEVEVRQRGVDRSFTVALDGSLLAKQVFTNELPSSVLQTLQRETSGGKVLDLYWINEEGDPVYYVEFQKGLALSTLTIAPDGWMTARREAWKDVPGPVQAAIRERWENRAPAEIDRANDVEEITYEVTERVKGHERLWIFNPDGSVAAEPLELDSVPSSAQAILARQCAGARIVHVFKIPQNGPPLYEVSFVRQEARHVCTVDVNGRIVSEEAPFKELPEALQKAIISKAAGRFIVKIEKLADEKGSAYEVTVRAQGKTEVLTFPDPPQPTRPQD